MIARNEAVKIQEGDYVETPDHFPIRTGIVRVVSPCGRYAVVEKQYGRKTWKNRYRIEELKFWKRIL